MIFADSLNWPEAAVVITTLVGVFTTVIFAIWIVERR